MWYSLVMYCINEVRGSNLYLFKKSIFAITLISAYCIMGSFIFIIKEVKLVYLAEGIKRM